MINLIEKIRTHDDYPIPGITFFDLFPAISESETFFYLIDQLYEVCKNYPVTKVVGIDARGLIFGAPLAYKFKAGFIPARKTNKLPGKIISEGYSKEYGTDNVAIQQDMITADDYVLIVDDIIATGGTAQALEKLIARYTKNICHLFLLELKELKGVTKLSCDYKIVYSI